MSSASCQTNNVVDFARYRAMRAQRALPLEDQPHALDPPRELSSRDVEHRRRMLANLERSPRLAIAGTDLRSSSQG